jgi:hypothetical protein
MFSSSIFIISWLSIDGILTRGKRENNPHLSPYQNLTPCPLSRTRSTAGRGGVQRTRHAVSLQALGGRGRTWHAVSVEALEGWREGGGDGQEDTARRVRTGVGGKGADVARRVCRGVGGMEGRGYTAVLIGGVCNGLNDGDGQGQRAGGGCRTGGEV